jgi:hypothetical protein
MGKRLRCYLKRMKRIVLLRRRTAKSLKTPIASQRDLEDAIVVYPEVIKGNPLGARKVVRWFLHRPGFHVTGPLNYGKNEELYFYYQDVFDTAGLGPTRGSKLYFPVILENVFRQTNFGARQGTCYVLRKGASRPLRHDIRSGIVVDDLPHREIAKVFNSCEYCISYDLYTAYSVYAAICGCKTIVVPEPGLSREAWQPVAEHRYGVAYGEDDLEWAARTRPMLLDQMKREQAASLERVQGFAEECCKFFTSRVLST